METIDFLPSLSSPNFTFILRFIDDDFNYWHCAFFFEFSFWLAILVSKFVNYELQLGFEDGMSSSKRGLKIYSAWAPLSLD